MYAKCQLLCYVSTAGFEHNGTLKWQNWLMAGKASLRGQTVILVQQIGLWFSR